MPLAFLLTGSYDTIEKIRLSLAFVSMTSGPILDSSRQSDQPVTQLSGLGRASAAAEGGLG
jgi:hypothetical protein